MILTVKIVKYQKNLYQISNLVTKRGTKRNQSTTSARKRDGSLDFLLPILLLKTEYNLIFDINDIFLGYKISYKFDLQSSWD